ncbi:putative 60s ribosomal protein mitochondrial precursor -like protein [Lasiodiplodia theobromae]|uniref:Large ribosomal subunit protein mL54 n=2 Tax=Lasiodiplodia TaxID=66739 RepID=A0A5N5D9Y9_9PEZI|nr:Ribosomal protein l37 mitochondrial [Lasiodiplodia theobromae]KAB2574034.1 54S ribosomal protein L37 [Lasiodiplodia theobromae]KAF4536586.1 Ribosomal protein l37 mitochondrial [Lasiodiplodia theobromae]KAF9633719.1 putative 60s ribosomal protein mitochondrial precursor -like protein [Lasiodiplodia theobromae]KAK0661137.1 54S ribosomal protein L37 [Lasiodiplodia hormozganensis]
MICPRCLLRTGSRGLRSAAAANRAFTTTRAASAKAPTTDAARSASPAPPATSTSAAQPLSTPLTPSPDAAGVAKPGKPSSAPVLVQSSVPAGTPLKGLNFLKNKTDPVAMEDSEYPAWLWTTLQREGKSEEADEGDLFSKSKKQRRLAAKRLRKQAMLNPDLLAPKIPVYEQSIDLPAGDGTAKGSLEADKAREDLTKAMREQRRKAIKEANFLKAMG